MVLGKRVTFIPICCCLFWQSPWLATFSFLSVCTGASRSFVYHRKLRADREYLLKFSFSHCPLMLCDLFPCDAATHPGPSTRKVGLHQHPPGNETKDPPLSSLLMQPSSPLRFCVRKGKSEHKKLIIFFSFLFPSIFIVAPLL